MILKLNMSAGELPSEDRVLEAVRAAFESLREGHAVLPPQCSIVLPDSQGDCIYYPGYVRSARSFGVKISPYLEARKRRGLNPVTAYTLLVDSETGEPELLVDSKALTTERTAATTLLAVKELSASRPFCTVGIVGTGAVGRGHARYTARLFPKAKIFMYSPTAARLDDAGESRRMLIEAECKDALVTTTIEEILACDVIMLCTSSGLPVIEVGKTLPGCMITSVGTNLPSTHEIDWRLLPSLQVYCDYRETCMNTAGDMRLAIQNRDWSAGSILGDIPELLAKAAPLPDRGRTYFRATGLAIEDIAVAKLVGL